MARALVRVNTGAMQTLTHEVELPAGDAVDVILRDGATLRLRPPSARDIDALVAFFAGLSEQSRHSRFHGATRIDRASVDRLVPPDWIERGALAGVLSD